MQIVSVEFGNQANRSTDLTEYTIFVYNNGIGKWVQSTNFKTYIMQTTLVLSLD